MFLIDGSFEGSCLTFPDIITSLSSRNQRHGLCWSRHDLGVTTALYSVLQSSGLIRPQSGNMHA
jgi:hypothetical protein